MAFKCTKSASEHNVYVAFVCMDNTLPNKAFNKFGEGRSEECDHEVEDDNDSGSIRVEKSKAVHDLSDKEKNNQTILSCDFTDVNNKLQGNSFRDDARKIENIEEGYKNPNILKLTKMKWLTEHESNIDSSSSSVSTVSSCSLEEPPAYINDRHLSTILMFDRQQNLFGLSHIASDLPKSSCNKPKTKEKPLFPTTAIIQVCCVSKCCRNQSNTDFPMSLKCGFCAVGCGSCCVEPSCKPCCRKLYCCNLCDPINCCSPTNKGMKCKSFKCRTDDTGAYGLTISLNKRPKYEPEPILITPKASCILTKPLAARTCTHYPPCRPPSSCFPYLMPCFWPARPSAPCNASKCFHTPRCPPPRCPKLPKQYLCPTHKKCTETNKPCQNSACAMYGKTTTKDGNIQEMETSESGTEVPTKKKRKSK